MRIAVANWADRVVGGAETYLRSVLPALRATGAEVAFWSEQTIQADRVSIVPEGVQSWSVGDVGLDAAAAALADWRPDVIYSHGFVDPEVEARLLSVAPSVFFAHSYYGMCISGAKTMRWPEVVPCGRKFGPACLAIFFPRRCGGANPLTMLREYRVQSRRLDLMGEYGAVLCASKHMREELLKHGVPPARVVVAHYPVDPPVGGRASGPIAPPVAPDEPWRILFAGRIEPQKGVHLLLEALPAVRSRVQRPLEVVLAGEGRQRPELEARARALAAADEGLRIEFPGWLSGQSLADAMRGAHVLAFPSIWPEPFGIAGVEAAHVGLPAVAFDVGGIPDWLVHGTSGILAPGERPAAAGLADALVRILDPATFSRLSAGALETSRRFSMPEHLARLDEALAMVRRTHSLGTPA